MKTITEKNSYISKVMVWWFVLIPLSAATLCRPGHQYWHESLEKCVNCSKCPEVGHVVLRPCEIHQDTQCGPLSDLDIDWSFLGRPRANKSSRRSSHHHNHHHSSEEKQSGDTKRWSDVHIEDDHSYHGHTKSEEDSEHFMLHRNPHSHSTFTSSESVDRKGHKNSHRKKWTSSEEISSTQTGDDSPRKHQKHHHHHKNQSKSETYSIRPTKPLAHNHNKTRNHHHKKIKWSSSETIDSFDFPNIANSSEVNHEEGHRWSFSEMSSSSEHHDVSTTFKKSNSTKKHSHHHSHHAHPHMKHTNTSETHKHHGKKHKLKNLQEERSEVKVSFPESASQLKESETVVNSTESGIKNSRPLSETGHQGPPEQHPESQKHFQKIVTPPSVSSAPFSRAEEIIWDWQAVALGLAVFACLLFFLVACAYSVHHARQWRRLKDHFEDFEADVGELSTRLSLLLPAMHPEEGSSVPADCCTNSSQCVYLEQLLARKRQVEEGGEHGNVYIDRNITNNSRG